MTTCYLILGIGILLACLIDALWTTIVPHGAGPLTAMISRLLGYFAHRTPTALRPLAMRTSGSVTLLAIPTLWLLMFWTGWWALFSVEPSSIVHASTGEPANAVARAYFVGYSISTLGLGDYVPAQGIWQILTTVSSLGGLTLITLSISYLIPVLGAATQKRVLGAMIRDLASSPQDFLISRWDGQKISGLTSPLLEQIWPGLELHAQRHRAYPVLHYFRVSKAADSFAVGIARLYETVLMVRYAVDSDAGPPAWKLDLLERSISTFLDHIAHRYIKAGFEPPPFPDLSQLRSAGIPLVDTEMWVEAIAQRARYRSLAGALVRDSGWRWEDTQLQSFDKTKNTDEEFHG